MIIIFFYIYDEHTSTTVPVEVADESSLTEQERDFIFEDKVRKIWHAEEEDWYFSIVDVCQVLTDSVDGRKYWNKLKQRLGEGGSVLVTICHQLKTMVHRSTHSPMQFF